MGAGQGAHRVSWLRPTALAERGESLEDPLLTLLPSRRDLVNRTGNASTVQRQILQLVIP
jgi:hypothetical protein